MQLELLELTIVGLILIPPIILAILHLLDFSKSDGRDKLTAIYGFLAFVLIFSYFTQSFFIVLDLSIIVLIYGTGLTFLPVWTLSQAKPDWLESLKIPFTIMFLAVWATYVIPRIFMSINLLPYFLAIVFALSIIFLLPGLMNDFKRILIVLGLALFYLERSWTLFDPITESLILVAALWLILIWYLMNKRSS